MAETMEQVKLIPEAAHQMEPKRNRHVAIALSHMNKRREALLAKRAALTKEIEELDAAILALE